MAKTLTEAKITTREQRKKLAPSGQPYWRAIDLEVHLGYRKGKRGGSWLVRWRNGKGYLHQTFGTADDELREGTLAFDAAVKRAKEIVEQERKNERAAAVGPALRVRDAVEGYVAERDARDSRRNGRDTRSDAASRLSRYVTGQSAKGKRKAIDPAPLAEIPLHELTEGDLLHWRAALPGTLKGTTKRRLFNDLKAALNRAYTDNRSRLPSTLPATIKHGLRAVDDGDEAEPIARENQILSDGDIGRLIQAAREIDAEQGWDGALYRLVVLLAATGARMSQLVRMRVGDVDLEKSRLMIPVSRKGRGKAGSTPVRVGQDVLDALRPATTGRSKGAPLLERWRSKQIAGSIRWERVGRGPWQSPSELTRPWAAIRERAGMGEVIPYALRHSSIVRQLRLGQPTSFVAKLHDTGIPMIERHYGRYIADALDELAARGVVPLIPTNDDGNIVRLMRA